MRVKWETWGGKKYEGEVIENDGDCLRVRLDSGEVKAVDINGFEVVSD